MFEVVNRDDISHVTPTSNNHLCMCMHIQGGPKNGFFFRLDNFVTVSPRKACSMSKFSKFYPEKSTTCISVSLNILCQSC